MLLSNILSGGLWATPNENWPNMPDGAMLGQHSMMM